ncbi:DUF1992 domain-containing protein [Neobacillus sp. PS3-12]|jgi:hypothetical protein|uniref:DnaJ family domain-containing protein n=1 Tax=Neobacillus sp. PS3-12 TaxID=3070677 RepID=UPI0027E02839|nr:DnaJ family domain-containing protein [Neobacillus sp. PS3-12]WML51215.1 DUF1992 domain-containing protein [Neobacillus sp. PS3-12]
MDLFHIIAEEKIKQAIKDGELDRLPGMGKPLKLDDLSSIPEELRMAYRIMKNAGYTEEETDLRKELMTIEDLIKKCDNEDEKQSLQKQLNEKLLRFNRLMSKRGVQTNSAMFKEYERKLTNNFKK